MLPYDRNLKERSRSLRENMTVTERNLWARLRMGQLGTTFYRQKPIGEYIVDFYCPKAKLVIEVDGSWHFSDDKMEYDRIRDESLSALGLRVLRFTNEDVLKHIDKVVESIAKHVRARTKSPFSPPLPKGDT